MNHKFNIALKVSFADIGKGKLLGLLFFLFTLISFAQPNQQDFDLNDPRNPNCPCHKYQKMADDEFIKLQKKNKIIDIVEVKDKQDLNVLEEKSKNSEISTDISHTRHTKKQMPELLKWRMQKRISFFTLRCPKKKKFKPRYSVCFKW